MNSKKSLFLKLFFLTVFIFQISAQMTVDPAHSFYEDSMKWQIKGYVSKLPPVRPYTYNNIVSILNSVIEKGNEQDSKIAKDYYKELTGKAWYLEFGYEADLHNKDFNFRHHPVIIGDAALLNNLVGIGYKFGWDLRTKEDENDFAPMYSFPKYDSIQDPAKLGPFYMYMDADTSISVGNDKIFAQAGLNRNGYGAFINSNIGKNEASYHSGNLVLTYMNDFVTYTQMMSTIGASSNYNGKALNPDKYFAMHIVELNPFKNFAFAYYENMIFGKRFDPIYLIPAPYMASQGLNGCKDNLQMGFYINYSFLNQFMAKVDVMVDDIDFNNAVKFNFNSKNRVVGQMGLEYVSPLSFLDTVELDYIAITPYTYSHWEDLEPGQSFDENTYNYQNYTNSGIKMGSQYDPNSDILSLSASFTPVTNFKIKTGFDFVRHGNISESITDLEAFEYLCAGANVYPTDGSIFVNSKINGTKVPTAWNQLNFLNQQHIMYMIRPSIKASYKLPTFFGKLKTTVGLSYTYEYIHNYGVNTNIFPGGDITAVDEEHFSWQGNDYEYTDEAKISEIVQYYKNQWINNLTDKNNHILSLNCTITW